MKDTKDETLEEEDINLRELKDFHKTIDEMLVDLTENAELYIILHTYFRKVVTVPSRSKFLKQFMKIIYGIHQSEI